MTYLAIIVLMGIAAAIVSRPILKGSRALQPEGGDTTPWDNLLSQRDAAYSAVKELDYEYQLGNLSESDYEALRSRYRAKAAAVLQELDTAMKAARDVPAPTAAAAKPRAGGRKTSARRTNQAGATMPLCTTCGQAVEAADAYCWNCGAGLGNRCTGCGSAYQPGDQFCAGCGTRLAKGLAKA